MLENVKETDKNGQLNIFSIVILLNKTGNLKVNDFFNFYNGIKIMSDKCLADYDNLTGLHGFRKCHHNENLNEMAQLFIIKLYNYHFKTVSSKMLSSSFMNYRR